MFLGGGGALWRVIVVQANNSFLSGLGSMESLFRAGGKADSHFFFLVKDTGHHVMPCLAESVTFFGSIAYIRSFRPSDFVSLFLQVNSLL